MMIPTAQKGSLHDGSSAPGCCICATDAADSVVCDGEFLDGLAADQMFLDDPLEASLVTMSIPGSLRIHDRDRPLHTDSEAVRLRTEDGSIIVDESELLEASLEELPGLLLLVRRRAITTHAKKDMSLVVAEVQLGGDPFETLGCGCFFRH